MNIHLHHSISAATLAVAEISGISFYRNECNSLDLEAKSLAYARKMLAQASVKLDEYVSERDAIKQGAR